MSTSSHILITGTGRAGTTFLIELLTHLGADTGFTIQDIPKFKHSESHAGLEYDIRQPNPPYIVKSPWLCDYIQEVTTNPNLQIEHVFIPIRSIQAAAESRCRIHHLGIEFGGLVWTENEAEQENILIHKFYNLILSLSHHHIPISFLQFPELVKDPTYTYHKLACSNTRLAQMLRLIPWEIFKNKFTSVANPKLIHL